MLQVFVMTVEKKKVVMSTYNRLDKCWYGYTVGIVIVQSPIHVQLFATPWTVACQASLSLTISRSFPKFMSVASVMPSSHLIL